MPAVQAHKQIPHCLPVSCFNPLQLFCGEAQRFFHINVFAGRKCFHNEFCMAVMLCGYGNQINIRIFQQFLVFICGIVKEKGFVCLSRCNSACCCQSPEMIEAAVSHSGQHGIACKHPCSNQPKVNLIFTYGLFIRLCRSSGFDDRLPFRRILPIFQQYPDIFLMPWILRYHFISLCRLREINNMGNQIRNT